MLCKLGLSSSFSSESSYFRVHNALIQKEESAELLGIGRGRISFGAVID